MQSRKEICLKTPALDSQVQVLFLNNGAAKAGGDWEVDRAGREGGKIKGPYPHGQFLLRESHLRKYLIYFPLS